MSNDQRGSASDPALQQSDMTVQQQYGGDGGPRLIDTDDGRRFIRTEISNYLSMATFPTTGPELRQMATQNDAHEEVIEVLWRLPDEAYYSNPDEVWDALAF